MEELDRLEAHFPLQVLQVIDARLNQVGQAHTLLKRATEIRNTKAQSVTPLSMTLEQQEAAFVTGNYMGGPDLFALANNGLKEFWARRLEHRANRILDDDTY